jgi:CBS domain containing-hemolysin-like protein
MVPRARLAGIDATTPFHEVLRIVAASPYSRLPVFRGSLDDVVGMLHTKDVVSGFVGPQPRNSVAPLIKPIVRVQASMPADRLLTFLRERRTHQALVVDDGARVVGLITVEDVVAELLGGVSDEFKTTPLRAIALRDGRVRLPGTMRLDQAAPVVGVWKPSTGTVGAFVASALGHPVQPGERYDVGGIEVEIEAVEGTSISSVIVAVPNRKPSR